MQNDLLKVCLMNDSFPPQIDGVAMTVMNYAQIIQKKYGESIVAVPHFPHVVDDYPFPVVRYQSLDVRKLVGYTAGNPFWLPDVAHIAEMNPTILHSHCPMASTVLARSLKQVTGAPLIMTYHTKFDIDFAKALKSKLLREAALKLLVDNVNACDEIWAVSRGAGENLCSLGFQGEYVVMPNGVDMPKGKVSPEEMTKVREMYEISEDIPTLLFVGRLMWYKGIRLILDALKMLKKEKQKFKMIFVGSGGDEEEIKKYAEESGFEKNEVLFIGPLRDRSMIRSIYSVSDLFLFPSTYDTNGLVVREAAASGVASLLIRDSCASEDIEHGKTGFLADENAEDIAKLLLAILPDRDCLRKVGENAEREIFISWDDSVKRATERYHYLLEENAEGKLKKNKLPSDQIFKFTGECISNIQKLVDSYERFISFFAPDNEDDKW